MDQALADLYDKLDRTPENSAKDRLNLERMINGLEDEIVHRGELAFAWYS